MPDKHFDNVERARMDHPERRDLLPQEHILALLNIEANDTVLDIGAGAGYFTLPLVEETNEKVYAVDIDQDMLDYIQKLANKHNVKNLTLLRNPLEKISLDSSSIDRALASMVLHEVETLQSALEEIYRILKPGGRFVIIDWVPEPNDPRSNRIDSGVMQRAAEKIGFSLDVITTPSEKVYAIAFDKPHS